jgi:hypothetical protein
MPSEFNDPLWHQVPIISGVLVGFALALLPGHGAGRHKAEPNH